MTSTDVPRIVPLSDSAVLVEFGNAISTELNERAIGLCAYFETNPFPGFVEAVPAYASAAIYYDVSKVRRLTGSGGFDFVRSRVSLALKCLGSVEHMGREVAIEARFGGEYGPDLEEVAQRAGRTIDDVLRLFTGQTYRVYMLGFLPGFSYMGEVDERIATPRRVTPRTRVPKGSIGIAGRQTGIYSLDSPGGWQIIGRTKMDMFLPGENPPSRLSPGDRVRFMPV